MSALVERIIAARDLLGGVVEKERRAIIRDALADVADELYRLETKVIPGLNEQITEQFAIGTKFAAIALKAERERDELLEALQFYADETAWNQPPVKTVAHELFGRAYENQASKVRNDRGGVARAAIAKAEGRV